MSKHGSADDRLHTSNSVKSQHAKMYASIPRDNSAPQAPKIGTQAKNQYR